MKKKQKPDFVFYSQETAAKVTETGKIVLKQMMKRWKEKKTLEK